MIFHLCFYHDPAIVRTKISTDIDSGISVILFNVSIKFYKKKLKVVPLFRTSFMSYNGLTKSVHKSHIYLTVSRQIITSNMIKNRNYTFYFKKYPHTPEKKNNRGLYWTTTVRLLTNKWMDIVELIDKFVFWLDRLDELIDKSIVFIFFFFVFKNIVEILKFGRS